MKIFKHLVCMAMALLCSSVMALNIDKSSITNKKTFGIMFPDGTSIYANADLLASISRQEYYVGAIFVTEVSIDLLGAGSKIRIYNAKILQSGQAIDDIKKKIPENMRSQINIPATVTNAINKAEIYGTPLSNKQRVYKEYPITTNSHTLEFVVDDVDELNLFYDKISSDYTGKPLSENASAIFKMENNVGGKIYKVGADPDDASKKVKSKNASGQRTDKQPTVTNVK